MRALGEDLTVFRDKSQPIGAQRRGMAHPSPELERFPEVEWPQTPVGTAYFSARLIGDRVCLRSAEVIGPTMQRISSPFEDGKELKSFNPPYVIFCTLPVDTDRSIRVMVSQGPINIHADEKPGAQDRRGR